MKTFKECIEFYTLADTAFRDYERTSPLRNSTDQTERSIFMFDRSKLSIIRDIAKENALFAFKTEYLDVFVKMIHHYMGKAMGKVTKERVCADFRSVTGYDIYFDQPQYSRGFLRIRVPNFLTIEVDVYGRIGENPAHLLVDNKFQPLEKENLAVENCPDAYVENIDERVESIIRSYREALEKQKIYYDKLKELKDQLPNFHRSFTNLSENYLP